MDPLLERLSRARAIAGQEDEVRQIIREAIEPHVESIEVDALGNLIAYKRGKSDPSGGQRVMVVAHMDEVGGMVSRIEEDGSLRMRSVGGIDPRILPGKRVRIGPEARLGVISTPPAHLNKSNAVTPIDKLVIDVGNGSGFQLGDMVTFEDDYGPVGRLLKGKAFDDRIGCYLLIRLLEAEYPCEVVGVFSAQEEIGVRGAQVAAYQVDPDVAIALEGTIADDLPGETDRGNVTALGEGPAISLMDRSAYADPRLVSLFLKVAEEESIPHQLKRPGVGGTDIGSVHLVREGVPGIAISVSCRYIHTPAALLDPADVEHTLMLLRAALNRSHLI